MKFLINVISYEIQSIETEQSIEMCVMSCNNCFVYMWRELSMCMYM